MFNLSSPLLPLIWLLVWLMTRPRKERRRKEYDRSKIVKIKLKVEDEIDENIMLVCAVKNLETNNHCAAVMNAETNKSWTMCANSQEKLEDLVRKAYEEMKNQA